MPLALGSGNFLNLGIFNGLVPKDGPRVIPITVDFTTQQTWMLDLTQQTALKIVGYIQCVFVDNSQNGETISIQTQTVRQTVVIPPYSQAFVPLLLVDGPVVNLSSAGGIPIMLHFLNVPMPLEVWSVRVAPVFSFTDNGYLQVSDPALEALIMDPDGGAGPGLAVYDLAGGGGGGTGLRLPADYRMIRSDLDSAVVGNIIAAAPRFYINSISVYCDPTAFRTASPGPVTFTLYQGGSDLINRTVNLGGAAVAAVSSPTGPVPLFELSNLDFWSTVDGENLRMGLSAGLSQGFIRTTIAGGSGTVP